MLTVKTCAKEVIVDCLSEVDLLMGLSRFNKKKFLFEKIFKKEMVLVWNQQ